MSKNTPYKTLCALLLAFCMLATAALPVMAQSQASTGQISGAITDSAGAAVADATVKATNTQTGLERTSTTNDDGLYQIILLPPGMYNVSAEASGFSATAMNNVEVVVGRTVDVNITLGASGVQEVVQVTAGAIQVQTTRSEPDAIVNERAIENLPINGRRFQDFVTLTPGAQVDPSRGQISLSGQRGINSNINVDGVDYNQPFFGGIRGGERSNTAFTIPQESIKEFQVVAAGYSAEFGRSTGGVVNAVTKSGTNEYHGSIFYLHRPQEAAQNTTFFDAVELNINQRRRARMLSDIEVTPAPTQRQFGGSVGGPIYKNKLFFFAAYEQQKFTNDRNVFFDNLAGFAPNAASLEAFDFYLGQEDPFTATNDAKALLGRIDYEISNNHRMNLRYSYSTNEALNSNATGNQLFPTTVSALSNNGTERDKTNTVVGQFTSFFTTSLVNEFRGQYSHERRPRDANAEEPTLSTGVGNTGTVSFLGQNTQSDWRVQAADSMTWSSGSHTVKFGVEFNHVNVEQLFGFNQFGAFNVSGSAASAAGAQTILDILAPGGVTANRFDSTAVTYLLQVGNLQAGYSSDEIAFFAQDSWRIRPNLTINYGLRWEGQYNPSPEANNDFLVNAVKNFPFPNGFDADPTQIPDDTDQFGPRFGFAYDPAGDGRTVIRGYAGVYYARTPLLLLAAPFNNFRDPAGDLSIQLPFTVPATNPNNTVYEQFKLIGIDLNNFALDNLPILTVDQIQQIAGALGLTVNPFFGAQPLLMAKDFNNPKSYQSGIGVEREINRSMTVGADFSYVHTVHLQRNRDINLPLPRVRPTDPAQRAFFGLRSGTPRPQPLLGSIQVRESTAKSLYRALTLRTKFQRPWGQFNMFYTLSKLLSDDDNERSSGGVTFENAFDVSREYSDAVLDRRHQFVASPVLFLPGGIDVSSALRFRSGRPIDVTLGNVGGAAGTDANEDRGGPDRPFLGPGVPFARNSARNKALYDWDMRVQKRFDLPGETARLILSLEIFNVMNLDNIELASTTATNFCGGTAPLDCGFRGPTNPNFLQLRDNDPTSTRFGSLLLTNNPGPPFQMQFGARFQF
jgi:outer membrane receptor for ferrienterochelin and colicin